MSDLPEIRLRDKCATCAFRPGTEANTWLTLVKAKLCVDTGTPFLCHEAPQAAWCAGAADLLTRTHERGQLLSDPEWKRELFAKLLDIIEHYEDADKAGLPPPDFERELRAALSSMESQ